MKNILKHLFLHCFRSIEKWTYCKRESGAWAEISSSITECMMQSIIITACEALDTKRSQNLTDPPPYFTATFPYKHLTFIRTCQSCSQPSIFILVSYDNTICSSNDIWWSSGSALREMLSIWTSFLQHFVTNCNCEKLCLPVKFKTWQPHETSTLQLYTNRLSNHPCVGL